MSASRHLCVLSDGKPGHENQSLGLAEAIARLVPASIRRITLPARRRGLTAIPGVLREARKGPTPDLLIAAGHSTHAPLLALARETGAPCAVLMKPSLPTALFDFCLIPRHDLAHSPDPSRIILTHGALNRVPPPIPSTSRKGGVILIGGPSSSHRWDGDTLLDAIALILSSRPLKAWKLTNSRRTPEGWIEACRQRFGSGITLFPHQETSRDWLPQTLSNAEEIWVTEDSVSMIYESLSSGARTGLLPLPLARKQSRVISGIRTLTQKGKIGYTDAQTINPPPTPPYLLREADRCAEILVSYLNRSS